MKTILFATNNEHKIFEANLICKDLIVFNGLKASNIDVSIPETGVTFEENAFQKANYIFKQYARNCMSEDSGLEVDALNGAPGVYSARYAGEHANHEQNIDLLLANLKNESNRKARFRAVIALILDGKTHYFEGSCEGRITTEPIGSGGFGYDPVFIPDGYDRTFAELGDDTKSKISHRSKALTKLQAFFINSK
jgi:XTP/dITP diphosphohydrolase